MGDPVNGGFTYMPFAQVPTRAAFDGRLHESDWRVLTYVAALTVNRNRRAWMAQQKLADRLGLDVRTVKRSIARLRDLGLIRVESNGRKGRARRNRYYVLHEEVGYSDGNGMWGPTGERELFDGPITNAPGGAQDVSRRRPEGDTADPHKGGNGGTATTIHGGTATTQEIEVREIETDSRKNPYGRDSRESRATPEEPLEDVVFKRRAAITYAEFLKRKAAELNG